MRIDTLNQSWLRRGMWAPAPWANTTDGVMLETELLIYRLETIEDEFHGFEGDSAAVTVWETLAHVEQTSQQAQDQVLASGGFVVSRRWDVFTPPVPDAMYMPVRNDFMVFDDPYGEHLTVQIDDVSQIDQEMRNHLELMGVEVS